MARRWEPALVPPDADAADVTVLRNSEQREVLSALQQLAPPHREVIVLRYWIRLSVEETAATLGMSKGTVKSRTARALRRLAELLGESR